jgi:hypothetical protein
MLDAKADDESCEASDNQHKQGNVLKTYVHQLLALLFPNSNPADRQRIQQALCPLFLTQSGILLDLAGLVLPIVLLPPHSMSS